MNLKISNTKEKILTCAIALVGLVILWFLKVPCWLEALCHIPCPGCGMTRAYIQVLHLNFIGAFQMHPMFWSVPILFGYYLTDGHLFKNKWVNIILLILIAAGFAANWVLKLITLV